MPQEWQIFIETTDTLQVGSLIKLNKEDSHHLSRVIRRKINDKIQLAQKDKGQRFLAKITSISEHVEVEVVQELLDNENSRIPVRSICFALCKGKKNDLVCEKATELGVEEINFWQADRSIVKLESEAKVSRLRKIAETASKQSKRKSIPKLNFFPNLAALLEHESSNEPQLNLACSLSEKAQPLSKIDRTVRNANILIGPEGDFSPSEEQALIKHSFLLVSLGSNTLRSETAAIAAIAMLQALGNIHSE